MCLLLKSIVGSGMIAQACWARGNFKEPTSCTFFSLMLMLNTVDMAGPFDDCRPPRTKKVSLVTLTTQASCVRWSKLEPSF